MAAKGATTASLDRIKSISQIENDQERRAAVAKDFHPAPGGRARSDADRLRNERSKAGDQSHGARRPRDGGEGREFDTLIRRDTTQAERRFSKITG